MDLRTSLGIAPDPDFELSLPPGWRRQPVDEQTRDTMLAGLRERLMQAQAPAAFATLRGLVEDSFAQMRREGAFAYISPVDQNESTLWLPASIIASVRRAPAGASLDAHVRSMIRHQAATPLLGDRRTLRVEREKIVKVANESLVSHSIAYLTPIPGSHRTRALELVAGFGRPLDSSGDDPDVRAMVTLFDVCASSLRWKPPTPDPIER